VPVSESAPKSGGVSMFLVDGPNATNTLAVDSHFIKSNFCVGVSDVVIVAIPAIVCPSSASFRQTSCHNIEPFCVSPAREDRVISPDGMVVISANLAVHDGAPSVVRVLLCHLTSDLVSSSLATSHTTNIEHAIPVVSSVYYMLAAGPG